MTTCEVDVTLTDVLERWDATNQHLANIHADLSSTGTWSILGQLQQQFAAFAINFTPIFASFSALGLTLQVVPGMDNVAAKLEALDLTTQIVKDKIDLVADNVGNVTGELVTANLRLYDLGSSMSNAVTQLGNVGDQVEIVAGRLAGPGDSVAGELDQMATAVAGAINTQGGGAVTQLSAVAANISGGTSAITGAMGTAIGDRIAAAGAPSVAARLDSVDETIGLSGLSIAQALATPGDSVSANISQAAASIGTDLEALAAALRAPGGLDIAGVLDQVRAVLVSAEVQLGLIATGTSDGLATVAARLAPADDSIAGQLDAIEQQLDDQVEELDRLADQAEASGLLWAELVPVVKLQIQNIEKVMELGLLQDVTHNVAGEVTTGTAWLGELNTTVFRFITVSQTVTVFGTNGVVLQISSTGPPFYIDG